MKLIASVSLLVSAFAVSNFAQAQAIEVSTTPVGVVTETIPAGNTIVASLFVNPSEFQGQSVSMVESGGNTVITFADSSFTASEFNEGSDFPLYFAEVVSGDGEGFSFDIISNTTNTITVFGLVKTDVGLTDIENIAIHKHITLSQFFDDAEGLFAFSDSVKFFNSDASTTSYLYLGDGSWLGEEGEEGANKPIYPGSAFIFSATSEVTRVSSGTVKTTATKVPVYAVPGVVNLAANSSPTDKTIGDLDLATQLVAFSDSIKFFEAGTLAGASSYLSDGSNMTQDFVNDGDSDPYFTGEGFLVSVSDTRYLTIPAPYQN